MQNEQAQVLQGAIDVHAHYVTKTYWDACQAAGEIPPDGISAMPDWNPEMAYRLMDSIGVATALLSISSPGVHFGDDAAARKLARQVNEEGANFVTNAQGRFGLLASIPLPDVAGALEEIAYALDTLHADGLTMHTNYHGKYPGDASFDPVMAELNKRQAVVFIHPTSPPCWEMLSFGRPRPILEFPMDTTRAVINMVLSRTLERYPDIRFVVPHTGGALSVLADRVQLIAPAFIEEIAKNPIDVVSALRRLYYDVAGAPLPRALPALLNLVETTQILYGSDFPFTSAAAVEALAEQLARTNVLNETQRQQMLYSNARHLFPRLKQ